jgi:hypothetical protein
VEGRSAVRVTDMTTSQYEDFADQMWLLVIEESNLYEFPDFSPPQSLDT